MEKYSVDGRVIPTINGGHGSGNWGHSGRPGKVGGSGKSSLGTRLRGRMTKGISEREYLHNIDGGFTIKTDTGETLRLGESNGYAVGGYGSEKVVSIEDWNKNKDKIVGDYYAKNHDKLDQEGYYLGGWTPARGKDRGKVFLDVSKVFKTEREAAKAMVETDQDAITDFKGFRFPKQDELVEKYGLQELQKKNKGKRAAERAS